MVRKNRMNGGAGGIPKDITEILKVEVYKYKDNKTIEIEYNTDKESEYSIHHFEKKKKDGTVISGFIISQKENDFRWFSFPDNLHYEYKHEIKTLRVFLSLSEAEEKERLDLDLEEKAISEAEKDSKEAAKAKYSGSRHNNNNDGGSSRKSKKSLKKKVASVKPIKTDNKYTDKDGVTRTLYTKDGCKYVKMVVYKKI